MARRLVDVLHHFDPGLAEAPAPGTPASGELEPQAAAGVAVPLEAGDLLRAGALWSLAVEVARSGGAAEVLASGCDGASPWPPAGPGPLGAHLTHLEAGAPADLAAAVAARVAALSGPGLVFGCLPRTSLAAALTAGLGRALLLVPPDRSALDEAADLASEALGAVPDARLGVTIHGARSVAEARRAFEALAARVEGRCGRPLESYGLLVDDLALYRGILERCPVGLARPQSLAARALADVARLLLEPPPETGP